MNKLAAMMFCLLVASFACKNGEDSGSSASERAPSGARDRVIAVASPLCTQAARDSVTTQASKWWSSKIDPTGRGAGPYAYAGATAKGTAAIAELVATMKSAGVELAPDPKAHRWEASSERARLSLEGVAKGEPGYVATFELVAKGGALTIERLSILRGPTRWTCGDDGSLVAAK